MNGAQILGRSHADTARSIARLLQGDPKRWVWEDGGHSKIAHRGGTGICIWVGGGIGQMDVRLPSGEHLWDDHSIWPFHPLHKRIVWRAFLVWNGQRPAFTAREREELARQKIDELLGVNTPPTGGSSASKT